VAIRDLLHSTPGDSERQCVHRQGSGG
jgi:hypothetical protein